MVLRKVLAEMEFFSDKMLPLGNRELSTGLLLFPLFESPNFYSRNKIIYYSNYAPYLWFSFHRVKEKMTNGL